LSLGAEKSRSRAVRTPRIDRPAAEGLRLIKLRAGKNWIVILSYPLCQAGPSLDTVYGAQAVCVSANL
jgi:hypothetical protein